MCLLSFRQRVREDLIRNKVMVNWPEDYLKLEKEYCKDELISFDNAISAYGIKVNRERVLNKRKEFNRLWNLTHTEKFN